MIKCEAAQNGLMDIIELCNVVSGKIVADFSSKAFFTHVATDSRDVVCGSLFVPLRGENQDGHNYIFQAVEKGAVCFFVDSCFFENSDNQNLIRSLCKKNMVCCIQVDNNLQALQNAATFYLSKFSNLLKIGITGSVGKTTTKEILVSILKQKYNTIFSRGNFNSETGLPLSVFNVRSNHEVAVFELGMNRVGEIKELTGIFKPFISVITNICPAHIGILGSLRAIAEEKKQIFSEFKDDSVGFISEGEFSDYLQNVPAGEVRVVNGDSIAGLKSVEDLGLDGFRLFYENEVINCPLVGRYNLDNIFMALAVAEFLKVEPEFIKKGLESVKTLFGRSEIMHGSVDYFLDCYNANPNSMRSVIDFASSLKTNGRKVFVLGSMLELGDFSKDAHIEMCNTAFASNADRVYIYGDEFVDAFKQSGVKDDRFLCFQTNRYDELEVDIDRYLSKNDFVLLKGSRGMALERLEKILNKESLK